MIINTYQEKKVGTSTYEECLGTDWKEGEEFEEYMRRANFYEATNINGFIDIWNNDNLPEEWFIHFDLEYLGLRDFYVKGFANFIDFLNFIGISFSTEFALKYYRVIGKSELEDEDYISVIPLDDGEVFVSRNKPILTRLERREASKRRKEWSQHDQT